MSEGKPRAEAEAGAEADVDLAEASFLDDEERAEAAWLVARDGDPAAPAPSPAIARDHAELEDLLGSLPAETSNDSWHDEVLKQAAAQAAPEAAPSAASPAAPSSRPRRRRTYRWAAGGALAAAAAVVAVVLLRPGPRARAGELEVSIRRGDLVRGAEQAAVGDRLIIRARPRGTGDLRVYRADGALVARCPGGPGCVSSAPGEQAIEVRLDAPVSHHVILVDGLAGELPGGALDAHLDAARAANARIVRSGPIDVR